jgi:hypothetical protein
LKRNSRVASMIGHSALFISVETERAANPKPSVR